MDEQEKLELSKEELIFLENSVKKLMDTGNTNLAFIMAKNVSKLIEEDVENDNKVKKI